ncbi:hypothetical protein K504DRAFT_515897 [Pleomassaria siparia CBS 279.74]|uniref:RING-type domain-containing protein n=1 Tax=Pleomassaria siparia CBS 279.74 TaxID=1314801 RepID=A0A6G1JVM9_9PLEO|nr:hypothetical protein K504DRAFT_515897 [Pleomassaria siparia CBS 279.74]
MCDPRRGSGHRGDNTGHPRRLMEREYAIWLMEREDGEEEVATRPTRGRQTYGEEYATWLMERENMEDVEGVATRPTRGRPGRQRRTTANAPVADNYSEFHGLTDTEFEAQMRPTSNTTRIHDDVENDHLRRSDFESDNAGEEEGALLSRTDGSTQTAPPGGPLPVRRRSLRSITERLHASAITAGVSDSSRQHFQASAAAARVAARATDSSRQHSHASAAAAATGVADFPRQHFQASSAAAGVAYPSRQHFLAILPGSGQIAPRCPTFRHRLENFAILSPEERAADPECPICFEDYNDTDHTAVRLGGVEGCTHVFGRGCLEEWINNGEGSARACPSCRRDLRNALIPQDGSRPRSGRLRPVRGRAGAEGLPSQRTFPSIATQDTEQRSLSSIQDELSYLRRDRDRLQQQIRMWREGRNMPVDAMDGASPRPRTVPPLGQLSASDVVEGSLNEATAYSLVGERIDRTDRTGYSSMLTAWRRPQQILLPERPVTRTEEDSDTSNPDDGPG